MTPRIARSIPVFYCSDPAVQAFVDEEAWNIGPYSVPEFIQSAREVFQAARDRFGDLRCYDLTIHHH
jgi:hypothetical protein